MKEVQIGQDVMNWMLEDSNPSIRYYVLTEILERKESDNEVIEARKTSANSGWVKEIFQGQMDNTYWETPQSCYVPKWNATVWRLIVLADLGVPGEDPRIKNSVEHFLRMHSVPEAGFSTFPYKPEVTTSQTKSHICMTGNIVRTLIRFGYSNDPRVHSAIEWLLATQQSDGGWDCYSEGSRGHGSFSSTIEPLWALSEIDRRSTEIDGAIQRSVEFFLRHKLYKSDRTNTPIMLDWTKFHYPLHYNYDVLHGLRVVSGAGPIGDNRLDDALELLISKVQEGGKWILEGVPRGWHIPEPYHSLDRAWRPEENEFVEQGWGDGRTFQLEEAGKPSKMITLNAWRVLKRMGVLKLPRSSQ